MDYQGFGLTGLSTRSTLILQFFIVSLKNLYIVKFLEIQIWLNYCSFYTIFTYFQNHLKQHLIVCNPQISPKFSIILTQLLLTLLITELKLLLTFTHTKFQPNSNQPNCWNIRKSHENFYISSKNKLFHSKPQKTTKRNCKICSHSETKQN